jgi:hypothetical protein
MSLLPQTMLQPAAPLGYWMSPDNKRVPVTIDQNWWLLIFQLVQLAIPSDGGLSPDALQDLAGADIDAADSDTAALGQQVQALFELTALEELPIPDASQALLLAQEGTLPDPAPAAQPIASVTVGASPFAYTASFAGNVAVTGGTVSAITIKRQGTTVATGLTVGLIPACRGDIVTVTYSAAPTMTFIPWSTS